MVDEYLSWDKHIDYISEKLKRNIGVIKRVCSVILKQSLVTLYRTLVEPYLRYGNSIWGQCGKIHIWKLQTLQNRAARIVTGKPFEETDHVLLLEELQWLNVEKLIDNDNPVLVYKMKNGITLDHCSEIYSFEEITHPYDTRAAHSKIFTAEQIQFVIWAKIFFIYRSKGLEQTSGAGERCAVTPYF